jgi:peptide deformylase
MIKPIIKDVLFLAQKSEIATKNDIVVMDDLIDTLRANFENCVGLAANMIGAKKCILVFAAGNRIVPMINPVVLNKQLKRVVYL